MLRLETVISDWNTMKETSLMDELNNSDIWNSNRFLYLGSMVHSHGLRKSLCSEKHDFWSELINFVFG
jgi:hypothetical protein